jgi:hypothetical protein
MLAYLFVLAAIAVRILSGVGTMGTMGFTPLGASLLFFGSRMPRRHYVGPLALLIAADVYLTTRVYGMSLTWDQGAVWLWYVGAFLLGSLLKDRIKPLYVAGAAVGSALSFFLITNFAVWLSGVMYPHTLGGLTACYVAAIPFFEKGLASDLLFSAILFSVPVFFAHLNRVPAEQRAAR